MMKNLFLITALSILLTSCAGKIVEVNLLKSDQKSITLENNYYEEQDIITSSHELFDNIEVIDDRQDQNLLGIKTYGEEEIKIINNQNLSNLIKDEIIDNLNKDNQFIDKNKTLKIILKTLKYNSQRGFFLGKSKAKIAIKASLIDNDTRHMEYGRTYNLENESPHFIVSLEKTDQKTINTTLRDAVNKILEEDSLQNVLIDQNNSSNDE